MAKTKTQTQTTKKAPAKKPAKKPAKAASKPVEPTVPEEIVTHTEAPQPYRREVTGVLFMLLALFTGISYFNTDGAFIRHFSELMKGLIGYGFWLLTPACVVTACIFFTHKGRPVSFRVTCSLLLPLFFASIVHLFAYVYSPELEGLKEIAGNMFKDGQQLKSGGMLGGLLSYGLESAFGAWGAFPILFVLIIVALMASFNTNPKKIYFSLKNRPQYDPERYGQHPVNSALQRSSVSAAPQRKQSAARTDDYSVDIPLGEEEESITLIDNMRAQDYSDELNFGKRRKPAQKKASAPNPTDGVKPMSTEEAADFAGVVDKISKIPANERADKPAKPAAELLKKTKAPEAAEKPVEKAKVKRISRDDVEIEAEEISSAIEKNSGEIPADEYKFPPVELLRTSNYAGVDARDEIRVNRERLETALHSFGINSRITTVIHGPTVTRYDIELEQGVKLARITNLSGDLALALGVVNVRIAPIPDKISTVGIEVPNKIVSTVYLRDIIDSPKFSGAKSKISFAIGKDISGEGVVGNIAKLPHLLIAGTTGSGKSVCMNSLILSLLYKARPDEVKLIMIDPKMVELGIYNGIPHLYVPVVTEPKKAAGALQWSVVEMLKRYRLFADVGVRDLEHYNIHCKQLDEPTLPQVVIVIDELADLMLVASKEVEESICRVAQMGRAAGMHLVIATQRPSADVITGLMKANIPSRIAFAVSSAMESRIILDQGGAEKLIGMGDMLFSPVGSGKPTRIQGAFVSDEEREDVIMFIKENAGTSETNDELVDFMNKSQENKDSKSAAEDSSGDGTSSDFDEMLPQAVEVVIEMKSCSVSMLQRRVKLGYSRAARIVDQMEELGVVGPYEGAKPRQVLVDMAGWREIQARMGWIKAEELDDPDMFGGEESVFDNDF